MDKILIIAVSLLLFGCIELSPLEKPFTIIGKYPTTHCSGGNTRYYYEDINGCERYFCDSLSAYKIGYVIN